MQVLDRMHDASHEQQQEQRHQDEVKGRIQPGMVLASLRLLFGQNGSPGYGLDMRRAAAGYWERGYPLYNLIVLDDPEAACCTDSVYVAVAADQVLSPEYWT
jgi:hypothetical protein